MLYQKNNSYNVLDYQTINKSFIYKSLLIQAAPDLTIKNVIQYEFIFLSSLFLIFAFYTKLVLLVEIILIVYYVWRQNIACILFKLVISEISYEIFSIFG